MNTAFTPEQLQAFHELRHGSSWAAERLPVVVAFALYVGMIALYVAQQLGAL